MAGGFTGFENTKSTEIFTAGASAWTTVGALPSPGCEFRATNLNNVVYLLGKYHSKAEMTKKAGSKLEVSTINCRYVHNYWDEDAIKYFD